MAGGYCAGKDTAVSILEEAGFPAIDVDAVGHRVLEERRQIVAGLFGSAVLGPGGQIDRKALGRIVFRAPGALARLEGVLHPRMREIVAGEVERLGRRCVINAAVLFRMGLHELCDLVLCVKAPLLTRLRRARRRDGLGALAAIRRIGSQRGICLKPMDMRVDIVTVRNAGSVDTLRDTLRREVLAVLEARRADS